VVVAALVAWYVVGYAISLPPTVPQASAAGVTNITVQTVASYGHQPHPDWVSYLVKNEQGQWVHSTIWKVPAHSIVRVTVYQYDGDSGLRNPFLGQPRGVIGGTMTTETRGSEGDLIERESSPFDLTFAMRRATGDRWMNVAVLPGDGS